MKRTLIISALILAACQPANAPETVAPEPVQTFEFYSADTVHHFALFNNQTLEYVTSTGPFVSLTDCNAELDAQIADIISRKGVIIVGKCVPCNRDGLPLNPPV